QNTAICVSIIAVFFLVYDKNISFLSAEGSFCIGNFVCGEVKNVGILTYSEAFDEMAGKIYRQKPVDLCGAPPNGGFYGSMGAAEDFDLGGSVG
ncbi:MAG: hypothetical protein IJN42_04680, partial [Clostridia bacterium]|nr:hypothetical protein [Clostridia bacterium]